MIWPGTVGGDLEQEGCAVELDQGSAARLPARMALAEETWREAEHESRKRVALLAERGIFPPLHATRILDEAPATVAARGSTATCGVTALLHRRGCMYRGEGISEAGERVAEVGMDLLELHERALDETARIVEGVQPDQMDLHTPCSDWDVRTLLGHMVGGNWNSAARAEGVPPRENADDLGDNPAEAFRTSAEAARQAWRQPERLDHVYDMPMGQMPGRAVLAIRLLEMVTHGWDLATATGQTPGYDDEVVQVAMQEAQQNLSGERPPGFPFAPPVEASDDLPPIDRLAAFMGRQP